MTTGAARPGQTRGTLTLILCLSLLLLPRLLPTPGSAPALTLETTADAPLDLTQARWYELRCVRGVGDELAQRLERARNRLGVELLRDPGRLLAIDGLGPITLNRLLRHGTLTRQKTP